MWAEQLSALLIATLCNNSNSNNDNTYINETNRYYKSNAIPLSFEVRSTQNHTAAQVLTPTPMTTSEFMVLVNVVDMLMIVLTHNVGSS